MIDNLLVKNNGKSSCLPGMLTSAVEHEPFDMNEVNFNTANRFSILAV